MPGPRPRELHEEFPHDAAMLRRLKLRDAQFGNLAGRYHAVTRAIHRIGAGSEPCADQFAARLRAQRLALLDEIAARLEQAELAVAAA